MTITPGRYPVQALSALSRVRVPATPSSWTRRRSCSRCARTRTRPAPSWTRWSTRRAAGPVVVALRADRLADLTAHAAFSRLVERGLYLVGGLDEARPPARR